MVEVVIIPQKQNSVNIFYLVVMIDNTDFEKALASIKYQYLELKSKCEALEQENALLSWELKDVIQNNNK